MQADITPEGLENQTFTTKLRGYDPDEVHAFLAEVALMMRDHKKQADRAYQAVGEEMGEMLQEARDRADAMIAAAEAQAAEKLAQADAAAAAARASGDEDAARTRADAEQSAAETRRSAEEDATRVRAEATNVAEETRTAAQRVAEERIARAAERVRVLVTQENEARERIAALRTALVDVSERLHELERDDSDGGGEEATSSAPIAADEEIELEPATEETASPAP